MKHFLLFIAAWVAFYFSHSQSSLPGPVSSGDQQGILKNGIPDGRWITHYKNGGIQFLRTYSFEKWQQFRHEKTRYHPKRVSMPLTRLYHENKKQAEKYLEPIHTFCALSDCPGSNDDPDHYHPPFKNGLLHGPFANYFTDGSIKDTGNYKEGLPEGLWTKWTDNKQYYWKGFYKHGLKSKEWKLYASTHKLIRIISYRDGKLLWRKELKEGLEVADID